MRYVLGIDIGGTTTAAAVSRLGDAGWSAPEVLGLGSRSPEVPSVLHLAADGALTVGEPVPPDPGRVARGFIRRVGDEVPLLVGGEPCTPQALTAVLARWVAELAVAREGQPADHIVVSHPARWGPHRRTLLRHALAEIDLAEVTLLPEPVVAAEHHAAHGPAGGTLAVYSLGGDDSESSVVRWADGFGFQLLARTAAVDQFGGADVDEALLERVQAALGPEVRDLRRAGPHSRLALFGLRRECVRARERLTAAAETEVLVPLPRGQVAVPVTRSELEEVVAPALQVTVDTLARTVRSCGLRAHQLDGVLLVGGAAQMPLVAELVSTALPGPAVVGVGRTAAAGAAVAAGRIATPSQVSGSALARTERHPGGGPDPEPSAGLGRGGGGAEPPPRPPVTVTPLTLPRMRPGLRRFGLVGGRA